MSSLGPPPGPPPGPPNSSQGLEPPLPPSPLPTDGTHFATRNQTSNLYLIAFLAILFVLLIISAGIVVRSYILRRRYQRRLEDALGTGQLLAPRAQGSKIKRLGSTPKIINAWVAEGGDKWNQMMPLSAQPVFVKRKVRTVKQNTQQDHQNQTTDLEVSDTTAQPTRTSKFFSRIRNSLSLNRSLEPESPDVVINNNESQTPIPSSTPNYRIRVEMLQLAVLITMPSPHNNAPKRNPILEKLDLDADDDEKESNDVLPEMVFGVTRVNYRQPSSSTLPPEPRPT